MPTLVPIPTECVPKSSGAARAADHALCHQRGRLLIRQARQQHGELIAADPCQRVAIADAALKAPPHELQRDIAHLVPEGVIDRLEAVEVQHEHGEHWCRGSRACRTA